MVLQDSTFKSVSFKCMYSYSSLALLCSTWPGDNARYPTILKLAGLLFLFFFPFFSFPSLLSVVSRHVSLLIVFVLDGDGRRRLRGLGLVARKGGHVIYLPVLLSAGVTLFSQRMSAMDVFPMSQGSSAKRLWGVIPDCQELQIKLSSRGNWWRIPVIRRSSREKKKEKRMWK
ncbi:hypothetical protein LY78DRAFT_107349 [Colletotrichum sublineola]|nr:hypothetical protein LY78DRAFT_107349 [Colletotrichum sublineola]